MININDMTTWHPSKYLTAFDLNFPVELKIAGVKAEPVKKAEKQGASEIEPLMYFEGVAKGLIISNENTKRLMRIFETKDSASLTGKTVKLVVEKVKAFGKINNVVRVFEPEKVEESEY